ncbi:MAG: hypothetical protein FWC93_06200 [Defluviitaleaceae bacterium]|nr:hypothetical protein [Defluviitaleaceae bacterium]
MEKRVVRIAACKQRAAFYIAHALFLMVVVVIGIVKPAKFAYLPVFMKRGILEIQKSLKGLAER